jgi:excisionase family DNA binding protein
MEIQSITFPRLGYSFAELEVLTGWSRSTIYRMSERGEIETVKRGRRRLVPAAQIAKLFRNDCATSEEEPSP